MVGVNGPVGASAVLRVGVDNSLEHVVVTLVIAMVPQRAPGRAIQILAKESGVVGPTGVRAQHPVVWVKRHAPEIACRKTSVKGIPLSIRSASYRVAIVSIFLTGNGD